MPGLVGFTTKHVKEPATKILKMATLLGTGTPAESIDSVVGTCSAMAADSRPSGLWGPRVASDDKGIIVGINGEIFGLYDENNLPVDNFRRGPDSEPAGELLKLYKRYGLSCIPRLRGFFSLAIWDDSQETLFLVTDRYALRSLYYLKTETGIFFGSEVKSLLDSPEQQLTTDNHGIAEFMLLGMPLGDRTLFRDIKTVPPATIIKIKNGREESKRYWHLRFQFDNKYLKQPEYAVKLFSDAFDQAVADSLDEPQENYELPLSGGLDSRCIAAAAEKTLSLRSYTMGGQDSRDLDLGVRIAGNLGIPNTPCHLDAVDFIKWMEPSVYITDGMYSPINASIMPIARILPGDARVVLDGANSFDGYYKCFELLFDFLKIKKNKPMKMAIKTCANPVIDEHLRIRHNLFQDSFIVTGKDYINKTYKQLVESVPSDQADNPFDTIDYLDQTNRIRRFNMMGAVLLRSRYEVRHPFFDHRVVDLVAGFPHIFRTKEKIILGRYLMQKNPFLANLHYERTGLPAHSGLAMHYISYAARAARKTLARVFPHLSEKPRVSINYMHWIQTDRKLQEYIRSILLDPKSLQRDHILSSAIEPCINKMFAGYADSMPIIFRLLSLELWYRYFIEGEAAPSGYFPN